MNGIHEVVGSIPISSTTFHPIFRAPLRHGLARVSVSKAAPGRAGFVELAGRAVG